MREYRSGFPARLIRGCGAVALMALTSVLVASPALAQSSVGPSQPLITQAVNPANLFVLAGNVRPEAANPANDRGAVADTLPMPHMLLQLRRPAAQEQAVDALIKQLHDLKSPNYHRWLSAREIGERFGPAESDIAAVTGWLVQQGFTVGTVYPNRMVIDFSGTAGVVRSAFHTEIHNLSVNGIAHIANMTDPEVPSALAPAIVGIIGLNDFRPQPAFVHTTDYDSLGGHDMTPGDLATIYNFNPLFAAGIAGQGQTIYIVEHGDLYSATDWSTFREAFGIPLSNYPTASLTTINPAPPSGPTNCTDPGTAIVEVTIDAEYASAAAPGAAIVLAACANASAPGVLIAVENLVNGPAPPAIISNSHLECEASLGASTNAAIYSAFQTGVIEGVSIYAAAGDQSGAACDLKAAGTGVATTGIGVNGFGSTPYNVAVGGTDFGDTYAAKFGGPPISTYWGANQPNWNSALSYIPEIPWNTTCGSQLIATYNGYSATYGSSGYCNSGISSSSSLLGNSGGSGAPSGCSSGSPSVSEVVGGTCAGYVNPEWQNGIFGMPNNFLRNVPDVSMFAADAPWKHDYIICFSDSSAGGVSPCTTSPTGWSFGWGGTSFGAPIWAGIQALINQYVGERQGLPNYRLYALAAGEYGTKGNASCNSSNGNTIGALCIFNDVTLGDNDIPCQADTNSILYNCYLPSGTYGVLSTSNGSYAPAFATAPGWDFATGLGTPNVYNLVTNWNGSFSLIDTHDFDGNSGNPLFPDYVFPGTSDILWRDTAGDVAIWLMNRNGEGVVPGSLGNVPPNWSVVGQRDFNGDGMADILWRDNNGNLAIWFMNGLQLASPSVALGNLPTNWNIHGTGNCIGGGHGDLLWLDTVGDLSVWYMNGATVASTQSLGNVGTGWTIVASDAHCDILWRDTSFDYAIWTLNGPTFQASSLGKVPSNWAVAGLGDFNGDGVIDILWRDSTTGTVAIWYLAGGGTVSSTVSYGVVASNWTIAQTGDYDASSTSDILWIDTMGDVVIWYMGLANNVAAVMSYGNVGAGWTVQSFNAE